MAVSKYNNCNCDYHIGKLEKVVYLINSDAVKDIHIDDGEAYIDGIEQEPLALHIYDIELTDTETLDERYKFTHTLKFSMQGYVNYMDFRQRYYAIIKTVGGVYWLVNPLFPCKVSYTYTLDSNGSHTDFTLATVSNHPTLRVKDMDEVTPYECGYKHCRIGDMLLNETAYSVKKDVNNVLYTNDGFKYIKYLRNTASFQEIFNGDTVQHTLRFRIRFDDYKSSWHYNLLEFVNNKYAAVIGMSNATVRADYDYMSCGDEVTEVELEENETPSNQSTVPLNELVGVGLDCNCSILVGFHFGLQPSFTVNATDDMEMDYIEINLADVHDNGSFISCGYVNIQKDDSFAFTDEYKECVDKNLARYILKKEVDSFGNSTGRYLALEGYETRFPNLNIVGTFDETEIVTCVDSACAGVECLAHTSLPNPLVLTMTGCTTYPFKCDTDWSFTSDNENITVTPSTGLANTDYTIEVCNTQEPSDDAANSTLTLEYCNTTKTFDVSVTSCFTAGRIFRITADEQYVNIPHKCCIINVTDTSGIAIDINIQDRYFRVFVPENGTGEERTLPLEVEFCDGTTGEVQIIQEFAYVRWVKEGEKCVNRDRCDIERKYTGLTADNINTWTDTTRIVNCHQSIECGILTRWIDAQETMCEDGYKFAVEKEQESIDYGESWYDTGNKRKGRMVADVEEECKIATCTEWRPDGHICDGTTKYVREREWYRDCEDCTNCASVWYPSNNFRKSDTIIEEYSRECGYDPCADWCISASCTEWRVVDTICEDCNKYEYLRQYFRICEDCNNCSKPWTATNLYMKGNLIEADSKDCCITPVEYEYRWVLTDGTICIGYDKYRLYKQQYRIAGSSDEWEDVVPTRTSYNGNGTMQPVLVEANSPDCGYVPPAPTPRYKWEVVGWTCEECDGSGGGDVPSTDTTKMRYKVVGDSTVYNVPTDTSTTITQSDYNNDGEIQTAFIGNSITAIGDNAFNDKQLLGRIMIPDTVTRIGNSAFTECKSLIDMTLPNSVTSIGDYAFKGDLQLRTLFMPNNLVSIGSYAFEGCESLMSFDFPSSLQTIGSCAFQNCHAIGDITLDHPMTVGRLAFYRCASLTYVTITDPNVTLGDYAFGIENRQGEVVIHSSLRKVTVTCLVPPYIGENCFEGHNEDLEILVPNAALDFYKSTSGWSAYAQYIKPIN